MKTMCALFLFLLQAPVLATGQQVAAVQDRELAAVILPYNPFIAGDNISVPLRLVNKSAVTLSPEIRWQNSRSNIISLDMGETSAVTLPIYIGTPYRRITIEVYLENLLTETKKIDITTPGTHGKLQIDGPFIKNSAGNRVFIKIPDYRMKTLKPILETTLSITLAGSYPEGLGEMLAEYLSSSGSSVIINTAPKPFSGRGPGLFEDYAHMAEFMSEMEDRDIIIMFPNTESLLKKPVPENMVNSIDATLCIAARKFSSAVIASPFPSHPFPELFIPYVKSLELLAVKRNALFLDLHKLYGREQPGSERFFIHSPGIYRSLPDREGTRILAEKIITMLSE